MKAILTIIAAALATCVLCVSPTQSVPADGFARIPSLASIAGNWYCVKEVEGNIHLSGDNFVAIENADIDTESVPDSINNLIEITNDSAYSIYANRITLCWKRTPLIIDNHTLLDGLSWSYGDPIGVFRYGDTLIIDCYGQRDSVDIVERAYLVQVAISIPQPWWGERCE